MNLVVCSNSNAGLMWGAHRLRQALAVIDAPRERGRSASCS